MEYNCTLQLPGYTYYEGSTRIVSAQSLHAPLRVHPATYVQCQWQCHLGSGSGSGSGYLGDDALRTLSNCKLHASYPTPGDRRTDSMKLTMMAGVYLAPMTGACARLTSPRRLNDNGNLTRSAKLHLSFHDERMLAKKCNSAFLIREAIASGANLHA